MSDSTHYLWGGDREPLDLAVLAGGESSEREVSLSSGRCVAAALSRCGHEVATLDPAIVDLFSINWAQFDACFVALHGGAGEDGRVQIQLEELGIPYTGSGPVASRLAMSKSATKGRLMQHGVATPPGVTFHAGSEPEDIAGRCGPLGLPVVIKPDGQGCSLGVGVARTGEEIFQQSQRAGQFEAFLVAEKFIEGRELTVAVIDREPLPVLEIFHSHDCFDYDVKFGRESIRHAFPADAVARECADLAVAAAEAVGTRGLARVDIMLDDRGQGWVLEVNTVPGTTERSLAPLAARRIGLSMPQFCDRLVRACLAEDVAV